MSKKRIKTLVIWGVVIAIVVTAIVLLVTVVNKKEETPIYQIEGTTLVQYNGKEETVVIPKEVKLVGKAAFKNNTAVKTIKFESGSEVTQIAMNAFEGCAALEEISLPQSLKTIGDNAFLNCVSLEYIQLPNNVTSIGKSSFEGCVSLVDITLNEGLETIGDNSFVNCANLVLFTLPSTVSSFGSNVFNGATSLESILVSGTNTKYSATNNVLYADGGKEIVVSAKVKTDELSIPNTVTKIHANAFYNASAVEKLTVANSVTHIEANAFSGCPNLEEVKLPFIGETLDGPTAFDSVFGITLEKLQSIYISQGTKVIEKAFSGISTVKSIELPYTITYVGEAAFENCSSLQSIIGLPTNLTIIKDNTFNGCTNLSARLIKSLINDNLQVIGKGAFANCIKLDSIEIPSNVKHIGQGAFEDCSGLTSITLPFVGMGYEYTHLSDGGTSIGTVLDQNKLFGYIFSSTQVTSNAGIIPYSLKTVTITGDYDVYEKAFINCTTIVTINLNDNVQKIGAQAFLGCTSLVSFTLPSNVTSIGASAFEKCNKLTEVVNFPARLEVINDNLFYNCTSLMNITINENINKIGKFAFYNCSAQIVVDQNNQHFEVNNNSLYTKGLKTLIRYQALSSEESSFTIPAETESILAGAFLKADNLNEIIIPSTVKKIDQYAIVNCKKLQNLVLPFIGNVSEEDADETVRNDNFECIFAGDKPSSLVLTINNGSVIGEGAFSNNSYIKEIRLSDTFNEIESSAFANCSALENVVFGTETNPAKITKIGEYAFSGCNSLKSIQLADTITEIGSNAFAECSSIEKITLPKSLEILGDSVFMNCTSLKSLELSEENTHYNVVDLGTTLVTEDGKSLIFHADNTNVHGTVTTEHVQLFINDNYYYVLNDKVYDSYEFVNEVGTYNATDKIVVINEVTYKFDVAGVVYDSNDSVIASAKAYVNHLVIVLNNNVYYTSKASGETTYKIYSQIDKVQASEVGEYKESSLNIGSGNYVVKNGKIYQTEYTVDSKIENIYSYAFSSSKYLEKIVLHDGITTLGDGVFYNSKKLKHVVLPSSLQNIPTRTFEGCYSLTDLTNISNITVVGDAAFKYCTDYNSESLISQLTEIGLYAFEGCESISNIVFNDELITISIGAFKDCKVLTTIKYPTKLTSIDDYAFQNCPLLVSYELPESLLSIGKGAYQNSTSSVTLRDQEIMIIFPEKLEFIGASAFSGANQVDIVYIPVSVKTIEVDGVYFGAITSIFSDAIAVSEVEQEDGSMKTVQTPPKEWDAFTNFQGDKYGKGQFEMKDGKPTPIKSEEEETNTPE